MDRRRAARLRPDAARAVGRDRLGSGVRRAAIVAWLRSLRADLLARARDGAGAARSTLPAWTRADTHALLLVLLLVPAVMGPPYRNLGRADETGTRYYRAYFTADFVWHSALAYELGKFSLPPRNPYMAPRAMNYYWTYFLLPATVAETAAIAPLRNVERCLKANAVLSGVLMIGALFLLVRTAAGAACASGTCRRPGSAGGERRGHLRDRDAALGRPTAVRAARHQHRRHHQLALRRACASTTSRARCGTRRSTRPPSR